MPYEIRTTNPHNEQQQFISYENIAASFQSDKPYEAQQAQRGVDQCLLALEYLPAALHLESFATEKFHRVSQSFAQLHGYTTEELRHVLLSDLCTPERRDTLEHYHNLALQAGDADFETEHERKDGSCFPVRIEMRLLQHPGKPIALLSTVTPQKEGISPQEEFQSERQRYTRAFDKMRAELEQARRQMSENTHLTHEHLYHAEAFMDLMENAEEYGISPQELQEWRDEIRRAANIYALLREAQQGGDFSHRVPLRPVLEKRLEDWRTTYPDRPLESEVTEVRLHIRQLLALMSALHQIIQNAYQHGAGHILVTAHPTEGDLTATVSDQGAGFPEGFTPRTGSGAAGSENTRGLGVVSRTQWSLSPIPGEIRYENVAEGGAQVMLRFPMW